MEGEELVACDEENAGSLGAVKFRELVGVTG